MPKSKHKTVRQEPESFAYIRVSMKDQNVDRQVIAMEGCKIAPGNIFIEKKSGKDFERSEYKRLLKTLRSGDLLHIKSIDRLGRNYEEIIEQWRLLTREKGVDIKVLDMPLLDTTYCRDLLGTFIADLVLQILSYTAQTEREYMLQRQAEGIAAAKAKGVVFGRRSKELPDNFHEIYREWQDKELSADEAAKRCGFSVRTFYGRTAELRAGEV